MSLNFDKVGEPIAIVKNDKNPKREKIIYVNPNIKIKTRSDFKRLIVDDSVGDYLQQHPNVKYRISYITGKSGSGKSTYVSKLADEYIKENKNNNIFLFSSLAEDDKLDKNRKIKRIHLNEDLIENPISIEDCKDALFIFDDVDNIRNDDIRDEVYKLIHTIAETGRHTNTMCLVTNHLPSNGKRTRQILNECSVFVYFPHGANNKINYILDNYIGMNKKFNANIKKRDSRWCAIYMNHPTVVMLENEIFIPDD